MDPRQSSQPIVRASVGALARFNARHPWNHNAHFHDWVVGNLPRRAASALDVGCGAGELLARLRERVPQVVGIDQDPTMVGIARDRTARDAGVRVVQASLAEFADSGAGPFSAVTAVAVLHHLDLDTALPRLRDLVAPGGRLLVVGLARVATPVDLAFDLASALLNPLVGLWRHPRPVREAPVPDPMPVRVPQQTVPEIRAAAARHLPGARVRRRLFFRYTLRWDRP